MYTNTIEGWMTQEELSWLYSTASGMRSIVEVGCWKGRSTHALLSACPGTVYAVDHWRGSEGERTTNHAEALTSDIYTQFMANVGYFPNLTVVREESVVAAQRMPHVDMVFLDAGHQWYDVSRDLYSWYPLTQRLICGHDYTHEWSEVLEAVNAFFEDRPVRRVGTIWYYWIGDKT